MLYYLPLPSLEQRYTLQWDWMYPEIFLREGFEVEVIEGVSFPSELGGKLFLDYKTTLVWFLSQLERLLKDYKLKKDDIVFLPDGEMPGCEALSYFRQFYDIQFKIVQIWHAGTYDRWDLTYQYGCEPFGKYFENGWMNTVDLIFVGSQFHKNLILSKRSVDKRKIVVTGLPIDYHKIKGFRREKEDYIVFTGRKTVEKGFDIIQKLNSKFNYNIAVSLDLTETKSQYYNLLGAAKGVIAPSLQETFGYGVIEGMAVDCIPIVPDSLSYRETVPAKYRYKPVSNLHQIKKKIDNVLNIDRQPSLSNHAEKYDYHKVIKIMADNIEKKLLVGD